MSDFNNGKIKLVNELTSQIVEDLNITDKNKEAKIKKRLLDSKQEELERFGDAIFRFGAKAILEAIQN